MVSPSQTELHEAPEAIVTIVRDDRRPQAERERAWAALAPIVRRQARRLAVGHGQVGQDLIDESVSWVLDPARLRSFDPAEGSFVAWSATVLRNRLHDLKRERHRRQRLGQANP